MSASPVLKTTDPLSGGANQRNFSKTAACGRAFSPESGFLMRVVSGHVRDASPTCTWPGIGPEGSVLRSALRCVTPTPGYRRNLANAALSVIASNCPPFSAQRTSCARLCLSPSPQVPTWRAQCGTAARTPDRRGFPCELVRSAPAAGRRARRCFPSVL